MTAPRFLGRVVGLCPVCQQVSSEDTPNDRGYRIICPGCHTYFMLHPLRGVTGDRDCDARCTGATGADCDCACGGANHGSDYL